ncbi:hypothetical protein M5689_024441 [Euphorbia peplus]|nr:hypothetical protein M5689_024441 [Euphorbia peplus]
MRFPSSRATHLWISLPPSPAATTPLPPPNLSLHIKPPPHSMPKHLFSAATHKALSPAAPLPSDLRSSSSLSLRDFKGACSSVIFDVGTPFTGSPFLLHE